MRTGDPRPSVLRETPEPIAVKPPSLQHSGKVARFIRPLVRQLHPYVPGEQPKIKGLIKLNTNENPFPPAPAVLRALRRAVDGRLRLYPNPTAQRLREKLAEFHSCSSENIFVGNGSDEVLALAVRAFVEPQGSGTEQSAATVQFFTPSYSLYPVLAAIHGSRANAFPLQADFGLPPLLQLARNKRWDKKAALTLITTPNAPSGRGYSRSQLEEICELQRGIVLLDEAYVDFARENALSLALKHPHVLVARTFSKAYSLCALRVGYCVGHPALIEALDKIRDSYNVNGLGQIAAEATLDHLSYYRKNFQQIIATRSRLSDQLAKLGFDVLPSKTNFILARPPNGLTAEQWLGALRERKILVRWFSATELRDYLRITIGTAQEANALVRAAKQILR
jgi:histidinol-phosphate aminotransferase